MTKIQEKIIKSLSHYKVEVAVVGGFIFLFLFAFTCYYFGIELTDMT